jgi:hypothetical protein
VDIFTDDGCPLPVAGAKGAHVFVPTTVVAPSTNIDNNNNNNNNNDNNLPAEDHPTNADMVVDPPPLIAMATSLQSCTVIDPQPTIRELSQPAGKQKHISSDSLKSPAFENSSPSLPSNSSVTVAVRH